MNRDKKIKTIVFVVIIIFSSAVGDIQAVNYDDASVYVPQPSALPSGWSIDQQSRQLTKGYQTPERFKKLQQVWRQKGRQIESQLSSLPKEQRQMFEMIKTVAEKLDDMEKRADDIKSQFHLQLRIKTGEKVTIRNRKINSVLIMALNVMVVSKASHARDWWEFYSDLNREQMGNAADMMKSLASGLDPDFAVNSLSGWGDEALEIRFGFDTDESGLSRAERNQVAALKSQMAVADTYGMVVRVGRVVFQVMTSGVGKMKSKQRVTREMMRLILKQKKGAMNAKVTDTGDGSLAVLLFGIGVALVMGGVGYGGSKLLNYLKSRASAPKGEAKSRPKASASPRPSGPQLKFDQPDTAESPTQSGPSLQFEEPGEPVESRPSSGPSLHFEEPEAAESQQKEPVKKIEKKREKKEEKEEKEQKEPVRLTLNSSVPEIESNGKDRVELTVQVLDRDSLPLAGQSVDFELLDGGTLTPMGTVTGPGGNVKALWLPEPDTHGSCRLGAFCPNYPDIYDRIFVQVERVRPVSITVRANPDLLPADDNSTADLTAAVTGKKGEPVNDAVVYFSTNQTKRLLGLKDRMVRTGTDGNARNQFTMESGIKEKSVEITALIRRFENKTYHPPLEGWCKIEVTPNSVEGTVTDSRRNPIEGAKVYLKNENEGWTTTEKTGPDGRFRFEDWDPGRYEIKAVKDGYEENKESRNEFYLERSSTVHSDLHLKEKRTIELHIHPETLEANGSDQAELAVKLLGPGKRPVQGERIQVKVEGENSGRLDRENAVTDPKGLVRLTYTASESRGEFSIRARPENQSLPEAKGIIKQEAYPYFDVEFADRIIRVYKKEEAEARTRGLTIAELEKIGVLRIDRKTPFIGTVGLDRFLVAAVYAVYGYKTDESFYSEQVSHFEQFSDGAREIAERLEKQRYDADWFNAMGAGLGDFKQYVDLLVMVISPPDPMKTAKTILAGGAKGMLTAFNLLLGAYSDLESAAAGGESWFSRKEWLSKDHCMEKMREALTQQIEAQKKMAETAEELSKSWDLIRPGSAAPDLRIRQVLPFDTRSDAYQLLWYLWEFLRAERRRLWFYTQYKRMESSPKLEKAREVLDQHETEMEAYKSNAKEIETMAKTMKSMWESASG